jgi:CO/xanthine dehydrogenase Mo-binding subunit/phosphohistidine swiveling domain-containing protein
VSGHPTSGSPARVGGVERVTGRQRYVADIHLEDELVVALVTIDCARGRILAIDTTAALEVPGVRLILTADDLPSPMPRFGPQFTDRPVLASGITSYHGEPVAAVAAETRDAAEAAARLVAVEYEVLPAVLSVDDALAPDAPLVQDPSLRPDDPRAGTNVLREHRYTWGDVETATADTVIERTYRFPMVTHFAIEPHGFIAAPDGDGIVVWSTIQHPSWLQKTIAGLLELPLAKVRVMAPDPGGAFGGKQHAKFEPLVAFMALRTARPVRLILSLEQTFQAVRRTSTEITVRTGLCADGTIVSQDIRADYLLGAYADIADRVASKGSFPGCGPYRVPNARIVTRSILSNTTPATAFRGFGNPQINWAVESTLDEAATLLGVDPLELRLRNLARRGERFIPTDTPADGEWEQTVRRAAELIDWGGPRPPGRGRGLAIGIKSGPTTGLSYALVRLLADGSVVIYSGTSDMGQGARTVLAQIAARELGCPIDWVTVVMGDTAVVPYDQQTSASRSTVLMGNAVLAACHDIQDQVRAMAARLDGVGEADVTIDDGSVHTPSGSASIADVVRRGLGRMGGELMGRGESRKQADPEHPLGGSAGFFELNCTAVEVEVDRDTGDIVIHRYVTVSDVGHSVNPLQVRGQDEGAAIMGLGHTLMEHLIHDDIGRIRNLGAIDYRIPTSMDLPLEMISETVENGDGPGPYGAKGMSEGALLCVASAVGAAVHDATGVRIRDLPLSPERVWQALHPEPSTEITIDTPGSSDLVTFILAFDDPHGLEPAELRRRIGGKGANLSLMTELGLPVPPGFSISTDACQAFLADGWPDGLDDELRTHMERLGAAVGRRFGDPDDPLLVSVRSGAPVSMPGMMDTILDLGLTEGTTHGLAAASGDPTFAAACRDRFVTMYCDIVGVQTVPDDPWLQLRGAIEAVFRSWESDRARAYREKVGIPDDLGTAVTVQAMVFGNRGSDSATGVLFTRDPATGEHRPFGDVLFDAQGEDVVAGTHQTLPISALDDRLPAAAAELRDHAARLERHFADCCDIEFTIERGRLWMLQVRTGKRSPQAALRMAVDMAEDEDFPLTKAEAVGRVAAVLADPPRTAARITDRPPIATGIPASPGIASGEVIVDCDEAIAAAAAGRPVLLVRSATSPDDIAAMSRAAGILTATGGAASHAAVVAREWGIPAVVGASAVRIDGRTVTIGDVDIADGDVVTIDGASGEVFLGTSDQAGATVQEVETLRAWARELSIDIDDARAESPHDPSPGSSGGGEHGAEHGGDLTPDLLLRTLLIKGYATPEAIADALDVPAEAAEAALDDLVASGSAEAAAGAFRLTTAGRSAGAAAIASDSAAWGADEAEAALDAFGALDHRMKETVSAWQLREVDGEQVVNDHADSAYDAGVVERLEALHADTSVWLAPLTAGLPRLGTYRRRLERARDALVGGDHRYVASPRVDSYHSVWFELHEDLIRLAGRTREDEVAAGRA